MLVVTENPGGRADVLKTIQPTDDLLISTMIFDVGFPAKREHAEGRALDGYVLSFFQH
jgi:hypothetical protein